jgi:hypothetical protein
MKEAENSYLLWSNNSNNNNNNRNSNHNIMMRFSNKIKYMAPLRPILVIRRTKPQHISINIDLYLNHLFLMKGSIIKRRSFWRMRLKKLWCQAQLSMQERSPTFLNQRYTKRLTTKIIMGHSFKIDHKILLHLEGAEWCLCSKTLLKVVALTLKVPGQQLVKKEDHLWNSRSLQ